MPQYYHTVGAQTPTEMTWQQVLDEVTSTSNQVYHNTLRSRQLRSQGHEKQANELKMQCGCILTGGRCQGKRTAQNLIALTLVGMVDIDHIPAAQMAEATRRVRDDGHTLFCAQTNSQQGLRIFFRYQVVNPADGQPWPESYFAKGADEPQADYLARVTPYHRTAWELGTRYYAGLTGLPSDKSCKDVVRISFLCHDPDAMLRRDAVPLVFGEAEVEPYRHTPNRPSPTDSAHAAPVRVRDVIEEKALQEFLFRVDEGMILKLIEQHGYQPTQRHNFWLRLGQKMRYFGHSIYEVDAYKTATLRLLDQRQLVLADDPSLRLPHEVEDAMIYGLQHGQEGSDEWLASYQQRFLGLADPSGATTPSAAASTTTDPDEEPPTDEDIIEQQCPLFPQSVYLNLPEQLWQGLAPVVDAVQKTGAPRRRQDALLMSLITNYSALCAETQLAYGTHHYSPNIAFICLSVAGNGKSEMSYGFRIVERVDSYLEEESRRARKEWQGQMDDYQLSMQDKKMTAEQKKALERPDAEPQDRLLVMPGTTSRSQFTLCMNAMGRDGLIINSTEIQTIAATLRLDVGDFSDLLCKAMSNERIDQFFKCDDRRIKIERPKLSVCLSGTFDQFHQFIPDYENGLFSRFGYMMMEPYIRWIDQQPNPEHDDYERDYEALADDAFRMWQMLQQCPTEVTFSPVQWQQHRQQWCQALDELVREGGQDRISVVNRHGLMHCRIATVLTVLRKWNEYKRVCESMKLRDEDRLRYMTVSFGQQYRKMLCRDDDFQTALQICQVMLNHALHLSTTIRRQPAKNVQEMQQWPWAVRCALEQGETFTAPKFIECANQNYRRCRSQAFRSLTAMVRQGLLSLVKRGHYRHTPLLKKMAGSR